MRKLANLIILIALFALIGFGITIFVINTNKGQSYVTNFIEETVTRSIGYKVKITNFKISWPCNIKSDHFVIADEKGNWLEVENIEVEVQPLSLFYKEVAISRLQAKRITASHIPKIDNNEETDNNNFTFGVSLKEIHLPLIVLSSSLTDLDKDLEISLKGDLIYNKSQKLLFNSETYVLKDLSSFLENMKITANGFYNINDKTLRVEEATINTSIFKIVGFTTINFQNEQVDGKYSFKCNELRKTNKDLKGQITDELVIHGTLKDMIVDGKLKITGLEYQDNNFPDSTLNHKLQYAAEQKIGKVEVISHDNELRFYTDFSIKNEYIKVDKLQLLYKENKISSNISYDLKLNALSGNIDILSKNLNILSTVLGYNIKGEAKALFNFSLLNRTQSIDINIESKNLFIEEFNASLLSAKIFIRDFRHAKLGSANIKLENVSHKGQETLKTILFKYKEKDLALNFTLSGNGKLSKELDFDIEGGFIANRHKFCILNFNKINGKYGASKIKGLNSIVINYNENENELKYNISEIYIDEGKISAHGMLSDNNISSTILLKQLPLLVKDASLSKEFADAKLNGEVTLSGNLLKPVINAHLKVSNIHLITDESAEFTVNSSYKENLLKMNSSIKSMQKNYSDFKITLPVELSLKPYRLEVEKDKKIKGSLNLNLKIGPIAALFLPPIHHLKGELSANLLIAGSLNSPLVTGNAFIKNGKYEHASTGIKIMNISSHINALGKSIVVQEFKATDSENGTFTVNGKWNLNRKNMPYDISLMANNFYFMNHPNVQATINGDLKIRGNATCASVKGNLEPMSLEIQLPERFAKDVPELNVVRIVFAPGAEEAVNSGSFFDQYKVTTDVTFNAKRKIFVRGWGLDVELGGKLTCKGFIEDPEIRGKLETIRGRYQEFGKEFTLKKGRLVFEDSIPPAPYLDIIGSTIQDDTEIRIILSGFILKPNLSIESTPSLPQEEALSMLLFGKHTTQISPFQALQLTDSLRRLSGHGGGGVNILNKARATLKVDDIKIKNDSADHKDAALGVGKYLTDKVHLEIEKGAQVGSGKTKVEVKIKNNLSIESSVGESGSSSIGINWWLDY